MPQLIFWKNFRNILPILGTATILWFLFSRIDFLEIRTTLITSNYLLLLIAFFAIIVAHPILALRWKTALLLSGYKISFKEIFFAYLANIPIAKLTPTYSGDFLRALYIKDKVPASIGAGVILLEAFIDISVLVVIVGISAFIEGEYLLCIVATMAVFGVIIFSLFVQMEWVRSRMVAYPKVQNFFRALSLFRSHKLGILLLSLLSLIAWFLLAIFFYYAFGAVGASVPLTSVLILQPVVILASLLPITISGVGLREAGMIVLYSQLASSTEILAVGLAYSFLSVVLLSLLCAPFTMRAFLQFGLK